MPSPDVDPTQIPSGPFSPSEVRILQITLGGQVLGRLSEQDNADRRLSGLSGTEWAELVRQGVIALDEIPPVALEGVIDLLRAEERKVG